jgi:hypothetical protein
MPPHIFTHLPKPSGGEASVGVVIGDGPAYFLSTRWLAAGETPEPIPAPPLAAPVAPVAAPGVAKASAEPVAPVADRVPATAGQPDDRSREQSAPAEQADDILSVDFDDFLK